MAPLRQECPVLYPTMEDMMGGFEAYIEKHEKKIAQAGLVKIVPPAGWQARKAGYPDNLDFTINSPIRQHATGRGGIYRMLYVEQKAMSLKDDFRPMALDKENVAPSTSDVFELERKFWKNVTLRPALYGADVPGSLFDEKCKVRDDRRGAPRRTAQTRVADGRNVLLERPLSKGSRAVAVARLVTQAFAVPDLRR